MNPAAHSATRFIVCPICWHDVATETIPGHITQEVQRGARPCSRPACQRQFAEREAALDAAWLARHDDD
jgi:hypothetical protein